MRRGFACKAMGFARVAMLVATWVAAWVDVWSSHAKAQGCVPVQLAASAGAASDAFASAAAATTDTIVFGAPNRSVGLNGFQGQAFVYRFVSGAWAAEGTLSAADGSSGDSLGFSASISGDTIIVGAPGKSVGGNAFQGAAYVFTRTGTVWTQQAKLLAGDGSAGDSFGCAVSIFADTAIVGAYAKSSGANFNQGAAYVFTRSGSVWTQQAKLIAADGAANDFFGFSVGAGLDTVVIGASGKAVSGRLAQGAAYVFTRSGAAWSHQARLEAADGATGDNFGSSASISGGSALIGAYHKAVALNEYQGAGYVFLRSGSAWSQQAKLVASDGGAFDYLGSSCVLSGDTAILGAPNQSVGGSDAQGSAYVFARIGTAWSQQSKLLEVNGQSGDMFGSSVALAGSAAVGGAPFRKVGSNPVQGAAFVFGSNIPINIIQQPDNLTACTPNGAAVSLTAAGTGPFSYQWQWKIGVAVPSWIPVANGTNTGGARTFVAANSATATLNLSAFQQLSPGLPFIELRCIVSNSCGSATSATAQISVCWADLNCDKFVNDSDFVLFATAYNLLDCAAPAMPPRCPADLNFDGFVDDLDFAIFANAYDTLVCP
ncbi:MAG: hypothetical protein KF691_12170 [Phycisphaeraceae bacterium]|nr:hypothetical protein [Phycisphaeraceae bacterium]